MDFDQRDQSAMTLPSLAELTEAGPPVQMLTRALNLAPGGVTIAVDQAGEVDLI